jgi:hypothetical protein
MEDNKNTQNNDQQGAGANNQNQNDQNNQNNQQNNNLSDFDKFLAQPGMQAEFDRRVAKGLETQKKNLSATMQQQINDAVANAVKEAQERAKMTAEQQKEYDDKKRTDELAKREAAIVRRELKASAKEKLQEKGLSSDLADFLDYTDETKMSESLEKLAKTYQTSIQAGVEAKLKGTEPMKKAPQNTDAELEAQIAAIMKQTMGL